MDDAARAAYWERLARVGTHPVQIEIYHRLVNRGATMSPIGMVREINDALAKMSRRQWPAWAPDGHLPLGNVSYHFRVLRDAGLIQVATTRQRRGAVEHLYRVVPLEDRRAA